MNKFLLMILIPVCCLGLRGLYSSEPSAKRLCVGGAVSVGEIENEGLRFVKKYNGSHVLVGPVKVLEGLKHLGIYIAVKTNSMASTTQLDEPVLVVQCKDCEEWVVSISSKIGKRSGTCERARSAIRAHARCVHANKDSKRCSSKDSSETLPDNRDAVSASSPAAFVPAPAAFSQQRIRDLNQKVDNALIARGQMPPDDHFPVIKLDPKKAKALQEKLDKMLYGKGPLEPGAFYEDCSDNEDVDDAE